jgi:hypothetical protein
MEELAEAEDQILRRATETRIDLDWSQQRETKKLLADKQRYAAEKHELERKVARLKDQINGSIAPKIFETKTDAWLAVFRSLAPIKLRYDSRLRLRRGAR